MTVEPEMKSGVSVAEMSRMVGLSRTRFHQLVTEGVFPSPLYHIHTRRPFFTEEMQSVCLEVRRRNCGIDGRAILFYARRFGTTTPKATKKKLTPSKTNGQFTDLVEGLRCLGLTTVTTLQVEVAVRQCFPNGRSGVDDGAVLRAVFLCLKRQNSNDNVAR
jgi:hypothetical protein